MRAILIDTSTKNLYVSFYDYDNNEIIYHVEKESHNNHSENIIGVIEEGLKENNIGLKDFSKVYIGVGPGSYTGLRVGMVVAKMIAYCINIPLYTISSLTYVASGYLCSDGVYAIYNIAKKNYCYAKVVEVKDGKLNVLVDDLFTSDEEFKNLANKYNATIVNDSNYMVNCENICKYSLACDDIHSLVPNYLRKANE